MIDVTAAPEKFNAAARNWGAIDAAPPSADEAMILARAVEGGALDHAIGLGYPGDALVRETMALAESILGRPISVDWFRRRLAAARFWTAYYRQLGKRSRNA